MTMLHHTIALDPTLVAHADSSDRADQTLQPRELLLTLSDGSTIRAQLLSSAPYHATPPVTHAWEFHPTSNTGGTITPGVVDDGGVVKSIGSAPASWTLSGVTVTTHYWIVVDFSAATATWGSGSTVPDDTPTVEYWEVLILTCAGGIITNIHHPYPADIHALLNP